MQQTFNDDVPTVICASEPHMACLFLIDTSGAMGDKLITELNAELNQFKSEVCEDRTTRNVLDIAIIEFSSTHRIVQKFVPIEFMEPVNLQASGVANMSSAMQMAVDMVGERCRFYRRLGTEPYTPWIFMISSGEPLDDISEIASVIQEMEKCGKLKFFSVGVAGYDSQMLDSFSASKIIKLEENNFRSFFDWVNMSISLRINAAWGEGIDYYHYILAQVSG